MNKWTREDHSLMQTLEKLDNDPNVVMGLTGNELFIIALTLQFICFVTVFPVIGLISGVWILAFGLTMCVGVLSIVAVGSRVAKMKEKEGGAGDIVWVNINIKISELLGTKSGVMTSKQRWSCDRTKRIQKNEN
jgi:conjugative transfer region protein (TIGR03750 family)